ncbi:MAG: hypothetical protein Q7U59_02140 [Lutibacter sp.]|nr:hypothetical protein [Lutibacter sp.]
MTKETALKLFEQKQVRSLWNEDEEKWYCSNVDVVAILTESKDVLAYWRKLKQRLKAEGNETVTNCHGLKMIAADGKMRNSGKNNTTRRGDFILNLGEIFKYINGSYLNLISHSSL